MADDTKQLNPPSSPEFSAEAIRSFLLGRLAGSEQVRFEERLFADNDLEMRVRLAECELTDDYAFDRLNAAERNLFEQKFLRAVGRQQKLNVSVALRERFATTRASARVDRFTGEALKRLFSFQQPLSKLVFGAVTLLILIGTVWLVIREPRLKETLKQRILAKRPAPPTAGRESHHPVNASQPEHPSTPSPMPPHEQRAAPPVITSVILHPTVSGQSQQMPLVSLPKGDNDVLRLQLILKSNQPEPLRGEILAFDGRTIFSALSLKSADNRPAEIDFDIPAHLLKAGQYQVRLSRVVDGSKGNLPGFSFRAQ